MKHLQNIVKKISRTNIYISILLLLSVSGIGFLWYQNSVLTEHIDMLTVALAEEKNKNASTTEELTSTTGALLVAQNNLEAEVQKMSVLAEQVRGVTGAVTILEKLTKTDSELLQKYSKVYFLNEHYKPPVVVIDSEYVYNKNKTYSIHEKVASQLTGLLGEIASTSSQLLVLSAFRSFGEQGILKSSYSVTYGEGTANQFSADQGYSEHQLGTAVDFTTSDIGENLALFKNTDGYAWLLANAHRYGFVLSYPENNAYYVFEPWHWRFIGIELATKLFNEGKHFYDVDQRVLDSYLISLFDGIK